MFDVDGEDNVNTGTPVRAEDSKTLTGSEQLLADISDMICRHAIQLTSLFQVGGVCECV